MPGPAKSTVAWAALWVAVLAASCDPNAAPPDSGPRVLVERFVAAPAAELRCAERMSALSQSFEWQVGALGITGTWGRPRPQRVVRVAGREAWVAALKDRVVLSVAVDWAAVEVGVIDVVVENRSPRSTETGEVVLRWGRDGVKPQNEHGARLVKGEPAADGRWRYRFWLPDNPGWSGRITRLQVVAVVPPQAEIAVLEIAGSALRLVPERVEAYARTGCHARLGGEVRHALPAWPGVPIERRLRMPRGGELRLAYGRAAGLGQPVAFSVRAQPEGGAAETVFDATLPAGPEADGWHEAVVDLAAFGGREVVLKLEVSSAAALDGAVALPWWGNPEILAPPR